MIPCCYLSFSTAVAQSRRPVDNEHPLWMIHIDVWNAADPQKIIDLMPDDIVTLKPVFAKGVNIADGIVTLRNADGTQSSVLYDLSGRRVTAPSKKGIYIKNGKKIWIH